MGVILLFYGITGVVFGAFCFFVASEKNRDPIAWFFLGFLFQIVPLLALIGVSALPKPTPASPESVAPSAADEKADFCHFCGAELGPEDSICPKCERKVR